MYADRGLLVEVDGMGPVDDVTARVFEALERDQRRRRLLTRRTAVFRDRGVEIKTPDQIETHARRRPGGRARPWTCCAADPSRA